MPENCAAIVIAAKHHELSKVKDTRGTTHTVGALRCKFDFRTNDWANAAKTAMFCNGNALLHPEVIKDAISVPLDADNECSVPLDVLTDTLPYSVGVWGVTDKGFRIVSRWLVFEAQDGCYAEGSAPSDPEPTVYEQILSISKKAVDAANEVTERANTGEFDGASAYQVAANNGYEGSESEWLASLVGDSGIGIIKSEINASGELVLTYSDGDVVNVGVVVGDGGDIPVDNALSAISTNPVQNQVITSEFASVHTSLNAHNDRIMALEQDSGSIDNLENMINNVNGLAQIAKNTADTALATANRAGNSGYAAKETIDREIKPELAALGEQVTDIEASVGGIDTSIAEVTKRVSDLENTSVVLYTAQSLAEEQKAQARKNIGVDESINVVTEQINKALGDADIANTSASQAHYRIDDVIGRVDDAMVDIDDLQETIKCLSGAMHFEGVVNSNPTAAGFNVANYQTGDVVVFGNKEFVFNGSNFVEFGDATGNASAITELDGRVKSLEGAKTVQYTKQTLTDSQKAQARENIGASSVAFYDDGEGNVTIEIDGGGEDGELNARVDTIETILFGAQEKPDPVVETVAVTNLVINPQFADGETGWSWYNQHGLMTPATSIDADGLCLDIDWAVVDTFMYTLRQRATKEDFTVGHRYYMYARTKYDGVMPQNAVPNIGFFGVTAPALETTAPAETGWTSMSAIIDLPSMPSGSLYVGTTNNYTGHNADVDAVAETFIHFNNLMCIDLTAAFGAGNEPDLATMNRWVTEQYALGFDGTVELALTTEGDEGDTGEGGLVGKIENLEKDVADLADTVRNSSISAVAQTGTVYPVLDDYYIANIDAARPTYYNAQEANALTFAMLADIHAYPSGAISPKNVEASSAWAKIVNHDFIMLGGDLINDSAAGMNRTAAMAVIDKVVEMAEKHARCPVYVVKGNHDTNELATGNENRLTDKEFYLHANARSEKYGMITDPDHPYGGYYYVDFPKQKIRMVCLNTSENYPDVDIFDPNVGDGNFRHIGVKSLNQMAWVENTALRVDEGWAVMMVSHIPPFNADNFHNRGTDNPALRALCENFAAGTGSFAEQGAREFIGHFSGHAHIDAYNEVDGLNYVIVNCTVADKRWDISLDRTDPADYLSLNSFILDRANRTVKCIKIGAKPDENYLGDWVDSFTW